MNETNQQLEVLGLPPNASSQEIEEAHRNLIKLWNPERFPGDKDLQDKAKVKLIEIDKAYHALMADILSEGQEKQRGQIQAVANTNDKQDTNKFSIWLAGRAEEIVADKEYQDDASDLTEQKKTSQPWMWSQEWYNTESESIMSKTENALEPILPETKEIQGSEAYLKQKQEWGALKAKLEIEAQQKVADSKDERTLKNSPKVEPITHVTSAPNTSPNVQSEEHYGPSQTSQATHSASVEWSSMFNTYRAIIGEKNSHYYLEKFKQFDKEGPGLKVSWNWPAFFCSGAWALYRKMYGWFFVIWGVATLAMIFNKAPFWLISIPAFLVPSIVFAMYANSLYHQAVKKKIATARLSVKDELKLMEYLRQKGGVQTWAFWVSASVLLFIILAIIIAVPAYVGYNKREKLEEVIYAMGAIKTAVMAYHTEAGYGPDGIVDAASIRNVLGIDVPEKYLTSIYVNSPDTDDVGSVIIATFNDVIGGEVSGTNIILSSSRDYRTWTWSGSLPETYRPKNGQEKKSLEVNQENTQSNTFQKSKVEAAVERVDSTRNGQLITPRNNAEELFNVAYDYAKSGKNQEAIEAFTRVIQMQPNNASAHAYLGFLYHKLGKYKEAEKAYIQAIRIRQDLAEAHCWLGLLYLSLNDRRAAFAEYSILRSLGRPELTENLLQELRK